MKRYTETQIIKHALQYYIKRQGASQEDIHREKTVLKKIEEEIEAPKERYGIPEK